MVSKRTSKTSRRVMSPEEFREKAREAAEAIQRKRAAAVIAADSLRAGRAAFTEKDGTREERIARTQDSALEFGRVYLPHYFEEEGASFHSVLDRVLTGDFTDREIEKWSKELGVEIHRGDPDLNLTAIQIFRGGGKSVIANLCDSLRRICHGLDPYLIIAGDTFAQAGAQLEDIKDELASNEKIAADFGKLKPVKGGAWDSVEMIQDEAGRVTWREGLIITANNVRVDAIGRGGKMRGRRHGAQRPTCAKLDDLDNDENVVTKEQRDKAWNWVMSAVIPAIDPKRGCVQIIGTTIHFDCVIARAERFKDEEGSYLFASIKFPVMRRDAKGQWVSNWPARFPIKKIMKLRSLLRSKFGPEYMNDPRDPDTQLFNLDKLIFYSPKELEGKKFKHICYVDPSKGKKGKGRKKSDFSSFVETLYDSETRITYIVDADRKRLTPSAARRKILEWFPAIVKVDPSAELTVEENSFGDILGAQFQDDLRAAGIDKVVHTLLHTEEKEARIERLSIRVENGGVRFPQKWEEENRRPEWFSEMTDYPGPYDDTIDGIESADSIGSRSVPAASSGKDPEGETSRDRMTRDRETRWLARMRGFGRRVA